MATSSYQQRIERARSIFDTSTGGGVSRATYSYLVEASHTSADEPAATSFYTDTQPELLEDELASNSIQHSAGASNDFVTSFSQPVTTSFAYIAKPDDRLSYIQEESETSAVELAKPTSNPVPSKRPFKGLRRKHVSKASFSRHTKSRSLIWPSICTHLCANRVFPPPTKPFLLRPNWLLHPFTQHPPQSVEKPDNTITVMITMMEKLKRHITIIM